MNYAEFLESKAQHGAAHGFAPPWMPAFLKDFQAALVEWAIHKGRAAIFADCGLGKTVMELVWAENVARQWQITRDEQDQFAVASQNKA